MYCKPQVQDGPSNNRNPRLVAVGLSSSAGLHWKTFTSCSCSSTLILRGESSKSWPCWLERNNKETLFPFFLREPRNPIWITSTATGSPIPFNPLTRCLDGVNRLEVATTIHIFFPNGLKREIISAIPIKLSVRVCIGMNRIGYWISCASRLQFLHTCL